MSTQFNSHHNLSTLGWKPFFQQQLTLEDYDTTRPARVTGQHRSLLELLTGKVLFDWMYGRIFGHHRR